MKLRTILFCVLIVGADTSRADTLIHAGRLIDGESSRALTEVTIRID